MPNKPGDRLPEHAQLRGAVTKIETRKARLERELRDTELRVARKKYELSRCMLERVEAQYRGGSDAA